MDEEVVEHDAREPCCLVKIVQAVADAAYVYGDAKNEAQ